MAGPNREDDIRNGIGEAGITVVRSWGGGDPKVPSEIAYSPAEAQNAQWGNDIGDSSFKLVWTKLELEEQGRLEELDVILKALDGMQNLDLNHIKRSMGMPVYPAKEPVEIVTDYLSLVREHLIQEDMLHSLGQATLDRTPIDLVLTCPTVC